MKIFDIEEARDQLSSLIDLAGKGEPFVIAVSGRPLVKVVAYEAAESKQVKRFGFMAGEIRIPADFDRMGEMQIAAMFSPNEATEN